MSFISQQRACYIFNIDAFACSYIIFPISTLEECPGKRCFSRLTADLLVHKLGNWQCSLLLDINCGLSLTEYLSYGSCTCDYLV